MIMVYIDHSMIDKIVRNNPDIVPFSKIIPDNERRDILRMMLDPNIREETLDRKSREILPYLEKVNPPIIKVEVPGYVIEGRLWWEYEDEDEKEPNLLYDYVLNHKCVPINLESILGSPYIYVVVYHRDLKGEKLETGYQVDVTRTMYLLKPDFISSDYDKETGRSTGKSGRLIKFRRGWVKVYGLIKYISPRERKVMEMKVLLLRLDVEWKRYGKPSSELVKIYGGSWSDYRRIKEELGKHDDKHLFGVVHYRLMVRGRGVKEGDIITNIKTMEMVKRPVKFGHQYLEVRKRDKVLFGGVEKVGEGVEVRLEPFKHVLKSTIVTRNKGERNRYWFQPSTFEVRKEDLGEVIRYVVYPKLPICRLELISSDHWDEGWGRVFVELREGEVLVFSHNRPIVYEVTLYPPPE
ncbi:MAG: hypothetical protein QW607_01865 [Desulfurococcaceae archaeon]